MNIKDVKKYLEKRHKQYILKGFEVKQNEFV